MGTETVTCHFSAENAIPCTCEMTHVESLCKYLVWGHYHGYPTGSEPLADRIDIEKYVGKYGQSRLDYRTIEATNPTIAAEMWVEKDACSREVYANQTALVYDEKGKLVAIVDVELQPRKFKGKARP